MDLEDFEDEDYAFVRNLFDGWTPDPMPSINWRGMVQDNSALDPFPVLTGKPEAPTVYGGWAIDYDELDGGYGTQAPLRYGRVTIACFSEPGARKGALRKLRKALRRLFDAAPDDLLGFDVAKAKVQRVGEVPGGWYVENFVIPFAGG